MPESTTYKQVIPNNQNTMQGKLVYPYSDELLNYEFNKTHPLKPDRLRLTRNLSERLGLLDLTENIRPTVPTREELEIFHDPEYVDAVEACKDGTCRNVRYGLGIADNPTFPGLYEAARRYVGATLDGMRAIMAGASKAFVISGGLHHAQRSEASGFCIFNDIVISIMHLLKEHECRVLYFDFDAHHGDGVQNAFYRSKDVLTISIHQTGRTLFPGTGNVFENGAGEGEGYSVNIPLAVGAGNEELIRSFDEVVVPLFESYQPNLLVTQMGVDGHYMDPLAHLAYTSHGYEYVIRRVKEMAEETCDLGWLAVGGGGYHVTNVARLWTLFLSLMLGVEIPYQIPKGFLEECEGIDYTKCPLTMRDEEETMQLYAARASIEDELDRVLERVRELVFPFHGL
ncbi:acetoin utilization protein AcuC [Candidatus Thorarchaeota archaeon]|nr:MAG: acetoin utilization protein AcuC [Candidatus Thorarchaeota archaeon]